MVKYREILRLNALGVSRRNIAFSCRCSPTTVQGVLKHARACGLEWPLPEEMTDVAIRVLIYPARQRQDERRAEIDHAHIAKQMTKRGMTMTLLWNEYCDSALQSGKQPLMFTQFCARQKKWGDAHSLSMHIERKPAEQIQVDWVGDIMQLCDPDTAELTRAYVFVACLPYSSYIFAEAFCSMDEQAWITAHVHAFDFFGGVTPLLVPDNCKTGVIKNVTDELVLNEQYRLMAEYYGVAVVPARPRKPKDKGAVEMSVGVIERQAIAPLRNRSFFSLQEMNAALSDRVDLINERPFQKREGSRTSVFLGQEKPALIPLPACPYTIVTRKHATVNFSYHVSFEGRWYSVPFTYVKREVEIVATKDTVSVMCDGARIAMHKRLYGMKGAYSTSIEHMPDAHRDFTEWNSERFRKWAKQIGSGCETCINAILRSHRIEQQAYRSCRALLGLEKKYTKTLLEEACSRAGALTSNPSYKTVKTIIARLAVDEPKDENIGAYLRGGDYYSNIDEGESK